MLYDLHIGFYVLFSERWSGRGEDIVLATKVSFSRRSCDGIGSAEIDFRVT